MGDILYVFGYITFCHWSKFIGKNFDFINSVDLYNVRIFQSSLVSQIIPMISQGHLYLGTLLSPILGLIFIFIATYFTKLIIEKNRFELFFVFH